MKPYLLAALSTVLWTAGDLAAQPTRRDARDAGWHTNYPAARAEARRTGKPLFVVFRCQP